MKTGTLLLLLAGLVTGGFFLYGGPLPVELVTKAAPLVMMIIYLLLLHGTGSYTRGIIAGLVISTVADVVIHLTFIPGLIIFLTAHIVYIAVFLRENRRLFLLRGVIVYCITAGIIVLLFAVGDLQGMGVPVVVYAFVIAFMLWRASARVGVDSIPNRSALLGLFGALLFILSDTLLVFDRFAFSIPLGGKIIMLTYWFGQLGITLSARYLKESR